MSLPAVAKVRLEIVDWRDGRGVVVVSALVGVTRFTEGAKAL